MREFFENMVSQEKKVRMMQEEYHRIKQSLDISGIRYENTGATSGSKKTDGMAEVIAEMVDFENEMKQEESKLAVMRLKATVTISKLTDDNEREVLRRWYLLQQAEEKIRNDMGYSQSMVYEFRKRGFKHLETSE
ncbi:MAG TPA: hypothetical protein PLH98_15790 [Ruminococcus flavefaciens]|nr:hypothetical protein [Ruminococcus flavefaciens]